MFQRSKSKIQEKAIIFRCIIIFIENIYLARLLSVGAPAREARLARFANFSCASQAAREIATCAGGGKFTSN